jgi:hypothetical protein
MLAPGVIGGNSSFGGISFGGSSVAENSVFINGLNVTDFYRDRASRTAPFAFFQEFQVKTGGYSVEFGRSTGGVINAVTRSGSNEFQGGCAGHDRARVVESHPQGPRVRRHRRTAPPRPPSTATSRDGSSLLRRPTFGRPGRSVKRPVVLLRHVRGSATPTRTYIDSSARLESGTGANSDFWGDQARLADQRQPPARVPRVLRRGRDLHHYVRLRLGQPASSATRAGDRATSGSGGDRAGPLTYTGHLGRQLRRPRPCTASTEPQPSAAPADGPCGLQIIVDACTGRPIERDGLPGDSGCHPDNSSINVAREDERDRCAPRLRVDARRPPVLRFGIDRGGHGLTRPHQLLPGPDGQELHRPIRPRHREACCPTAAVVPAGRRPRSSMARPRTSTGAPVSTEAQRVSTSRTPGASPTTCCCSSGLARRQASTTRPGAGGTFIKMDGPQRHDLRASASAGT